MLRMTGRGAEIKTPPLQPAFYDRRGGVPPPEKRKIIAEETVDL